MNRFFGMMPNSKVKIEKIFIDNCGLKSTIQAGEEGWAILYADHSSEYKDVKDTTENNYKKALEILKGHLGNIREV